MDAFFDLDHHHHEPQKDIFSSLFPSASSSSEQGNMQQQTPISMSFHRPASGTQTTDAPPSPATNFQNQLNMNMFNNMMQIQSAGDTLIGMAGQNSQGAGPSNPQFNAQTVFEQFKIHQLQQLQQLQNQIFQQQIALISGQPSFLPTSPSRSDVLSNTLSMSPVKGSSQTDAVSSYVGLPTPGPSSELRARDSAMDFVSPMILNTNSFIDSPVSSQSSKSNDHSLSQSHQSTDSHNQPQHYNSAPPQIAFQIQSTLSSHPTSPAFSGDDRSHSSTLSNVSVVPSGELNLSPIASPWFGPTNHKSHSQSSTDVGLHIHPTSYSGSGSGLGSNPNFLGETNFTGIHRGPLMPATPASIMNLGHTIGNSTEVGTVQQTPVTSSEKNQYLIPQRQDESAELIAHPTIKMKNGKHMEVSDLVDSDCTHTTIARKKPRHSQTVQLPVSHQQSSDGQHQTGSSSRDRNAEKAADKEKEASGKRRGSQTGNSMSIAVSRPRRATAGGNSSISPTLKTILPANPSDFAYDVPTLSRIDPQNQQPPRKTSHKAAEQKRRDSLKTTFDDLRTLLPPIPLPSEMDEFGSGGIIPGIPGAWPPRSASGLPGSLPPRGPPKAGSEGPNKGVSKLQLLICGNEYIRVLKSRIERRDEEIGRLRKGVSKLRTLLKETEGRNDTDVAMVDAEYGYDLDLERDLDAVELQTHNEGGGGIGIGTAGIGASVGFLGSVGELEEEDND